jgi:hypothetical protein
VRASRGRRSDRIEVLAEVTADGQLRLHTGDVYRNVNTAGSDLIDKECDGLAFWKLTRDDGSEISLRQLRDESPLVRTRVAQKGGSSLLVDINPRIRRADALLGALPEPDPPEVAVASDGALAKTRRDTHVSGLQTQERESGQGQPKVIEAAGPAR